MHAMTVQGLATAIDLDGANGAWVATVKGFSF